MSNYQPVSTEEHIGTYWNPPTDYRFASNDSICPLSITEVGKAMMSLPLAFVQQSDSVQMVAVLGLKANTNLCVGDNGGWLGPYVPAKLRPYPFSLGKTQQDEMILCVDEDSGLLSRDEGKPLFNDDKTPSDELIQIRDFLVQINQGIEIIPGITSVMAELELFEPWQIVMTDEQQSKTRIEGLLKINEQRLNELNGEDLKKLQDSKGMILAYAQMFSMQHIDALVSVLKFKVEQSKDGAHGFLLNQDDGDGGLNFENI